MSPFSGIYHVFMAIEENQNYRSLCLIMIIGCLGVLNWLVRQLAALTSFGDGRFSLSKQFSLCAKSIAIILCAFFLLLASGREKTKARKHRDLYAANIVRSPIQSHQIHAGRHLEAGLYHSHQQFRRQREDTALGERYQKSGMRPGETLP